MMELNDFGFTAIDSVEDRSDELDEAYEELQDYKNRLDNLYKAMLPLLDNLSKDMNKDTIYWPNRLSAITQFRAKLTSIKNGETNVNS